MKNKYLWLLGLSLLSSFALVFATIDSVNTLVDGVAKLDPRQVESLTKSFFFHKEWLVWVSNYSAVIPLGFQILFLSHIFIATFFSLRKLSAQKRFSLLKPMSSSIGVGCLIYFAPYFSTLFKDVVLQSRYAYGFLHFFRDDFSIIKKSSSEQVIFNIWPVILMAILALFLKLFTLAAIWTAPFVQIDVIVKCLALMCLSYTFLGTRKESLRNSVAFIALTGVIFLPALFLNKREDLILIAITGFSYHLFIWYLYYGFKFWRNKIKLFFLFFSFAACNAMGFALAYYCLESATLQLLAGTPGSFWGSSYYLVEVTFYNWPLFVIFDARVYHFWAVFHVTLSWFQIGKNS